MLDFWGVYTQQTNNNPGQRLAGNTATVVIIILPIALVLGGLILGFSN